MVGCLVEHNPADAWEGLTTFLRMKKGELNAWFFVAPGWTWNSTISGSVGAVGEWIWRAQRHEWKVLENSLVSLRSIRIWWLFLAFVASTFLMCLVAKCLKLLYLYFRKGLKTWSRVWFWALWGYGYGALSKTSLKSSYGECWPQTTRTYIKFCKPSSGLHKGSFLLWAIEGG